MFWIAISVQELMLRKYELARVVFGRTWGKGAERSAGIAAGGETGTLFRFP